MNPDNILLWPDGFWCFQDELDPGFLRDDNYSVIWAHSDEWEKIQLTNPLLPPPREPATLGLSPV